MTPDMQREQLLIERYVKDVKQGLKNVLDMLESMMKPSGLAKDELRRISSTMNPQKHLLEGFNVLDVGKKHGFRPEANAASEPSKP